jgi:general secretion pathway protein L
MSYLVIQLSAGQALFSRFREKGKRLFFVEAFQLPRGKEDDDPAALVEFAARAEGEEKIILSLPSSFYFMRELDRAIEDRRKQREILPMELKGETALEAEEMIFEALPLSNEKILALWAKRDALKKEIEGMAALGVEPWVVTSSLFHWHHLLPAEAQTGTAALWDGESLAVYQNGLPLFFRALDQEEVLTDIRRTLTALEIGKGLKIGRIFLHGKALSEGFSLGLSEGLEEISFTPLPLADELVEAFPDDKKAALDWAAGYALARAGSEGEPIDFRRGDLAYTAGRARLRRKLRIPLILVGLLAGLLFLETGTRYWLVKSDLDFLNASIRSVYREIFPSRQNPVDEVAEIRSEIKRLSGAATGPALLPVLKRLAELKGEDINGIYEIEIEGTQVRLKGDARSIEGINAFKARSTSLFSGTEVGEIRSRPDGIVGFVFRGTLKEGRP